MSGRSRALVGGRRALVSVALLAVAVTTTACGSDDPTDGSEIDPEDVTLPETVMDGKLTRGPVTSDEVTLKKATYDDGDSPHTNLQAMVTTSGLRQDADVYEENLEKYSDQDVYRDGDLVCAQDDGLHMIYCLTLLDDGAFTVIARWDDDDRDAPLSGITMPETADLTVELLEASR